MCSVASIIVLILVNASRYDAQRLEINRVRLMTFKWTSFETKFVLYHARFITECFLYHSILALTPLALAFVIWIHVFVYMFYGVNAPFELVNDQVTVRTNPEFIMKLTNSIICLNLIRLLYSNSRYDRSSYIYSRISEVTCNKCHVYRLVKNIVKYEHSWC